MNTDQRAIDNQHIDDITNMPSGVIKTKINIIVDFETASHSNLAVGNNKGIDPELFNGTTPIVSITTPTAHVNFIDSTSLSDEQKQQLLDSNATDFSDKKDLVQQGVHILPQMGISSFIDNIRGKSQNVDTVHIIGDISGLNIELDTPSLLPKFMTSVNLVEQKSYPFSQTRGETEFTFWGENNNDAYEAALEKELRQGTISKTLNLDDYEIKDNVILSSDNTPPIFYELD